MPKGGWIKKTATVQTKKPLNKKRSKTAGGAKKNFAAKVMSVVNKSSETMLATQTQPLVGFNSGITVVGDMMRVIPQIAQGDDDNNRKGDQISAFKLDLRGHLIMGATYTNTSADTRIAVRVIMAQPRNLADFNSVIASNVWLQHLIKRGSTSTSFTGTIQDLYSDINTDRIICWYDKIFYLSIPQTLTAAGAIDYKYTTKLFRIVLNWKNKILKYDTLDSGLSPTNFSPVLLMGYCHLDGSGPDTVDTQCSLAFNSNLYYKDL